ncbi:mammalian cell entry protein [Mycobacterium deserti]|uniref:Mammalian cell entry protein n=1 Tax=Mycobacterium deserti TaxID=2978347 RepID=A0ABT2M677_9MYCO|nr:mammalian cell entry protein [Mycobacterium deserti]MCT7657763.1 mammalian cell entry protein [Mycobacterium deserti]
MTDNTASTEKPSRRRASRAAGPAAGSPAVPAGTEVRVERQAPVTVKRPTVGAPPRRPANRRLVATIALLVTLLTCAFVATTAKVLADQRHEVEAEDAREQRFVDTASQTVTNMFSYTQETIDQNVDRFVEGTSGPLRDMMSQGNNVENLKLLFRDTNASAEAVINGAALEKIDEVANNASVLVAVRVTVTDLDGNNKPSQPYRLRIIVHEDDNGHMTSYDIKYPDGGN